MHMVLDATSRGGGGRASSKWDSLPPVSLTASSVASSKSTSALLSPASLPDPAAIGTPRMQRLFAITGGGSVAPSPRGSPTTVIPALVPTPRGGGGRVASGSSHAGPSASAIPSDPSTPSGWPHGGGGSSSSSSGGGGGDERVQRMQQMVSRLEAELRAERRRTDELREAADVRLLTLKGVPQLRKVVESQVRALKEAGAAEQAMREALDGRERAVASAVAEAVAEAEARAEEQREAAVQVAVAAAGRRHASELLALCAEMRTAEEAEAAAAMDRARVATHDESSASAQREAAWTAERKQLVVRVRRAEDEAGQARAQVERLESQLSAAAAAKEEELARGARAAAAAEAAAAAAEAAAAADREATAAVAKEAAVAREELKRSRTEAEAHRQEIARLEQAAQRHEAERAQAARQAAEEAVEAAFSQRLAVARAEAEERLQRSVREAKQEARREAEKELARARAAMQQELSQLAARATEELDRGMAASRRIAEEAKGEQAAAIEAATSQANARVRQLEALLEAAYARESARR